MNRFRKIILGGAVLALAAGPIALVKAQNSTTEPAKRPFARGERMHRGFATAPLISIALRHKTDLNLTADQVTNLEKIKDNYQSQVTPVRQQLVANEKEIAGLMQQSPADLIQIKSKIQDGEKYRSELRYMRIEALENGKSVLTAAQQDQLKTLVRSRWGHTRRPQGQPS
ncbi:MAG: Spy/CpxP family protein refolding chaperone [Chloroflexota bacterium]